MLYEIAAYLPYIFLLIILTRTYGEASDFSPSYFIENQQAITIKSGKAITRNTRRIINLSAVSSFDKIHVHWNTTPAPTDGVPGIFTLVGVYPTDFNGQSGTANEATNVILLQANISDYVFHLDELRDTRNHRGPSYNQDDTARGGLSSSRSDLATGGPSSSRNELQTGGPSYNQKLTSDIGSSKFLICVQIWHRNRGSERKLDENCISASILTESSAWNSNRNILVIFIVVIAVNLLLILTLIFVRLRRGKKTLPFAVKKWWKDVSDVLQEHTPRVEVLDETVRGGEVNSGLSVVSSGSPQLNNAMYAQNLSGRYQYPVSFNGRLLRQTVDNLYYAADGYGNQCEYSYVRQPSINQIYYVRNGLFSDTSRIEIV